MADPRGLLSPGFLAVNLQLALITAIAALFFIFFGYLSQLGIDPATAGFIISADALAALVVQPVIAPLVHAGTLRRWLLAGPLLLSGALFMLGRVTSPTWLAAARLLQGAGFIIVLAALVTLLVQFIPKEMSGRAFGWVSLVRLIPYALVPLLFERLAVSPALFARLVNIAALMALIPAAVLLFPRSRSTAAQESARPPGFAGLKQSLRAPAVMLLMGSAFLFFCGYSAIFFYLHPFGATRGIESGLFFTIATLTMIAVRLSASWLFDRFNKVLFCALGLLIAAASCALLPLVETIRALFLLALCSGLGWGIAMPLQAAAMFDISAPPARAMNQNLLMVMMQAGFFAGPLIGGRLIQQAGYPALFLVLAGTTLAAALLAAAVRLPTAPGSSF